MATQVYPPVERTAAHQDSPSPGVHALMCELVTQLSDGGSVGQPCDTEEVMVDAEIDGNRYLLVRLRKSDRLQIALSPREHEIARMVAKGHHNKAIAGVLNISSWTVCTHLRRIFAKLGVSSRTAMAARLLEVDIVREKQVTECAPPPVQRAARSRPMPEPLRPVPPQYPPVRARETDPRLRRVP